MKMANTWALLAAASCWCGAARAQLVFDTNAGPQSVFFGDARPVSATFRNTGGQDFKSEMRTKIYQASAATAIPLDARPWKELRVLARQTALETAPLDFPPVKAETAFLVQWLDDANRVLGASEVLVYPTNLLHELKLLVDESWNNLGVLDPANQLKPALKQAAIGFVDLAEAELENFSGKLALIGSCNPGDAEWNGLADRIGKLARKGTPVVWIQGPPRKRDQLRPSFYLVPQNRGAVLVVQPGLVADLPEHPPSQLNLVYFCKLAVQPEPFRLPNL
jgi:hypothetical protein